MLEITLVDVMVLGIKVTPVKQVRKFRQLLEFHDTNSSYQKKIKVSLLVN